MKVNDVLVALVDGILEPEGVAMSKVRTDVLLLELCRVKANLVDVVAERQLVAGQGA